MNLEPQQAPQPVTAIEKSPDVTPKSFHPGEHAHSPCDRPCRLLFLVRLQQVGVDRVIPGTGDALEDLPLGADEAHDLLPALLVSLPLMWLLGAKCLIARQRQPGSVRQRILFGDIPGASYQTFSLPTGQIVHPVQCLDKTRQILVRQQPATDT